MKAEQMKCAIGAMFLLVDGEDVQRQRWISQMKKYITYIRRCSVIMAFLLFYGISSAQEYGNEWVVQSQRYYKIKTAQDGMHRVTYEHLTSAGVPVSVINPRNLQIFHRGQEQAIYVNGQTSGTFGPDDYIEFYGQRNDGMLDEALFVSPQAHSNKYYSLFTDSSAYFLTWSVSQIGKRITRFEENNILGLPAVPFHHQTVMQLFTTEYSTGLHYPLGDTGAETFLSAFDYGEGWTGTRIRNGSTQDIQLSVPVQALGSGQVPVLEVLLAGRNNLNHNVTIEVGAAEASLRPIRTVEFSQHFDTLLIDNLQWSDIGVDGLLCRIRVNELGKSDQVSVTFVRLHVPSSFDHQSQEEAVYQIPPTATNRSYLEFQNVPLGSKLYDVSDTREMVEIGYNVDGSGINAMIMNDSRGRKLLLTATTKAIDNLEPVAMANPDLSADYIIITNKLLRTPSNSYDDPVSAYAAYRESADGGNFATSIVNIEELYHLFSYGETNPLAIYRFCRYMADQGSPKHVFIIGKGLTPNYDFYRQDFDQQAVKNLVPPAGYPGSDILFTAGLLGSTDEAGIPIGRIAASEPADVEAYLNKVKEHEALGNEELWQKEMIHLSGGRSPREQSLYKDYVDNLQQIARGHTLGGKVFTISKKVSGATEIINIAELVNEGKMMITFFGHSAPQVTDVDIGHVSNPSFGYNNKGKYPFMLVNGCVAGNMYSTVLDGFGEDWINTPDKGSIGFLAHSALGFSSLLKRHAEIFYEVAFADSVFINKSIGEIQKEVGRRYFDRFQGERHIAQVQQSALQGDPAVVLFKAQKPDFEASDDRVFASEGDDGTVNVFSDFNLGIVITNSGRTYRDSLQIAVRRETADGTVLQKDTVKVGSVFYQDTIYYEVRAEGVPSAGNNTFTIHVDPLNKIQELNETNNFATFELQVLGDITKNVAPYDFAIINEEQTTLVAQALDVLKGKRSFTFELDTSAHFDSPYRKSVLIGEQLVAKWNVNLLDDLPNSDSITFYWRTQFEDQPDETLKIWNQSSFTYVQNGSDGWAMNHFGQLEANMLTNLTLEPKTRTMEFERFETTLDVKTFGNQHPEFDYSSVQLKINDNDYIFPTRLCTDNSMNFVAFNRHNTVPYLGLGEPFVLDRKNCGIIPQVVNNMLKSEIETELMIEQYIDRVEDGDYVLAFSIGEVTYESWAASTVSKFEAIGVDISQLQSVSTGEPLIILGKKGLAVGEATIITADYSGDIAASEQEIVMSTSIDGQAFQGTMMSPRVGPAAKWISFSQRSTPAESPVSDTWSFNIYGINQMNEQELLIGEANPGEVDLGNISVEEYPFIQLEMLVSDEQNLTPAQLQHWYVLYEGVPEGILTYKQDQAISDIEIQEGELHEATFTFENVSAVAFSDSISIEYGLISPSGGAASKDTIKIQPLGANESIDFVTALETVGRVGDNDMQVFANPRILPEHDYNNNALNFRQYLTVAGDDTNPVLEVTVDGAFIMNGDIVAPSPLILLRLKDENSVLLKQDTTGINLYLNEQCESCTPTRVSFSSTNVSWTPASKDEDFKVQYQPENLADGIYTLKAEASDASGNPSGAQPYSVNFEIVNESQITNFYPYPNPFSTRTQFVFTLTGGIIPDDLIIQIMTVNGTIVREITMDEIGPIRIGHNRTEYAWDGRDEYGDQLANGVYLYRVKVFTNGREMAHRKSAGDKAFKNGFGKLYLLR
jgi:hypothetical protein